MKEPLGRGKARTMNVDEAELLRTRQISASRRQAAASKRQRRDAQRKRKHLVQLNPQILCRLKIKSTKRCLSPQVADFSPYLLCRLLFIPQKAILVHTMCWSAYGFSPPILRRLNS